MSQKPSLEVNTTDALMSSVCSLFAVKVILLLSDRTDSSDVASIKFDQEPDTECVSKDLCVEKYVLIIIASVGDCDSHALFSQFKITI